MSDISHLSTLMTEYIIEQANDKIFEIWRPCHMIFKYKRHVKKMLSMWIKMMRRGNNWTCKKYVLKNLDAVVINY